MNQKNMRRSSFYHYFGNVLGIFMSLTHEKDFIMYIELTDMMGGWKAMQYLDTIQQCC